MTSSPGKTRLSTIGLMLLATMAWLLPQWTDASSVIRSFQQRYQLTGRADSAVIGNHLLNCPTSSACTTARNGTGNNNDYTMGQVDIDGQAGTFNSSMAPLSIPVGSTVQRAYLYWGADTSAGGSGSAAPTPASRNQVRFSAAGGAYVTVTASTVDVSGNRYSAVADVTSLVASAGSGNYMTANVQAGTGSDRYAGWSLVVIYSNPTLPLRSLTLFDGSLNINSSAPTSITTSVSGFRTPATGAVDARIGLVAFEGDNASTGDQFLVNGTAISDALNPNNNIFNSTNSRLGVAQTGRNPQQSNMFGFDIDYIPVPAGVIVNNATSASLTFNTGGETYFPAALLFQTNVYEPEIVTNFSKAATDLNGGQFRPGDVLEYTIALSNTGDDAADQTVISDPLPLGLTYVPGSIEVVTGANAGAKTDAAGDDQAEYNAGTRTLTVRVGTGANASTGGRIAPVPQASSSTSVRFRAQIDLVQPNGASLSNIAGVSYVGATSGTSSSGNTPPSTVTVSRDADLSITKAGPASVVAGAPIQYTLTVSSLGPDAADGATVTDNVPAGITNVSITCAASGGATCPSTTGLTTLSAVALPAMPSGGQVVFTINGNAPMAGNTLSNTASVAAPSGTNDPTPGNNSAGPVVTTVDAGLDLAVTGALTTAGTIRTGDTVAYQFTVTNNGPIAAPGAPFTLPMPTGLAGATWTCAPVARCGLASGTGDISLSPTLAVGENVTINFSGTAPNTTPATLGDAVGTVAAPTGLGDSNPANNIATVPAVVVQAREITAGADSGSVVNGSVGGTAVANVLSNDTLDGAPATLATVSLAQVSTTHPNITLNPATGAIEVAAGTPAGTYTVTYQICELANPGNCDTASVTVTVGAAVIDAVDDDVTGAPVNGASGGTTVSVLANDTLDGAAVTVGVGGNVTLTPGAAPTPASGSITMNADGTITVAPGTTAGVYTYSYTVCEVLNPTNCDTATVTLVVDAAVIDAVADTGTVANGAAGGTAVANVLVNDTLNGAPATLASVTLSQLATTNPNVTLDVATGAVNVAPGTPAGTYTVTYQICEQLNPTNCDSSTVTVTVGAAVIDAVDDDVTGTPVNGASGGTLASVLANDTLDGAAVTVGVGGNVTLTPGAAPTPAAGSITMNADGTITVAPGTTAGAYTYAYTVCEVLNPTNCDTASVLIVVNAPQLTMGKTASAASFTVGVPASYTLQVTNTGTAATTASATVTDTIPAGLAIGVLPAGCTAAGQTVTCTIPAGLSVGSSTGFVVPVTPTAAAGVSVTNTATVSGGGDPTCPAAARCTSTAGPTPVDPVAIVALGDSGTVASGAAGGTAVPSVLVNDTLGVNPATLATVTLSQVSTTNPNVTLNPATGAVNVAPGTPAGTYTVTYQICEQLNPTNCDTATVTVTVGAAVIDAVDDDLTGSPLNGFAGGTTASVLANDTLGGSAVTVGVGGNVTLTPGAAPTPAAGSITMNADGTITVAAGTTAGVYTYSYTVCEVLNPTNCDTATVTLVVGAAVIDAVDDTGALANGASGGTAVVNVLANDTLDGAPATLATVTLSQLATTNPNVTLDPATGAVNVAPGTPAGTYNVTYEVCEILNPSNCDVAQVTVTVGAAPIDAVADTGTVANGAAGGTAVPNVLVNDTLNGVPATLANVVVTQSATTNPNVTLDVATGAVNVAAGTPAGTYTVTYQICEQLNPTNCDTATVTVTVGAAVIDAVDDDVTGAPVNGASGGTTVSVLVNDTLDGAAVTVGVGGNVTLTPGAAPTPAAGGITMNADGTITVAAGTTAGVYTYSYTVCEVLNPTNCDTATVTLVVDAAVIDAVADSGTVANGASGGTAVVNVLANDTLDGASATLASVTLSQLATTNPNVTLDAATGAVNVTPGTPAGTYNVTYEVCEILNPSNCDVAQVTVTVGAAPIEAVADTGTVANGAAGGTAVPNVLVNDTLNGLPATLANVVVTQSATTNPNVTLNPATGAVKVAPGTPAGTYTVTYQICEQLNPTNCDSATVTVTVGAAVIDAVDDTGTVANGASGGTAVANVLVNDTMNGAAASLANVTLSQVSTTNPNVTLDVATGAVNVAAGTPAGTYTVTYQICEQLNPTNCDSATVTVTVGAAVIDAVDDTGTVGNGASGGTAVADVLVNDTLNGAAASLTTVTLTQVSTTNPNVTLDVATGGVNVAAGTPAGTYTVTYQICEQLNPTNCDTATVTVTVGAAVIDAVDDTGTVANGASGGAAVANVLVNDTLNGAAASLANVTLTQVSTTNPNATLDVATGAVNVAAGTPAGTYTVTYQICEQLNPTNCDTATVTVTVGAAVIDAVNDTGIVANGASGGTAVANVLVNDTLNGGPATLATVTLTQVSTTNPNVTLDVATGAVNVAPGTPAGTYTVTYQICEQLNPTNCDTATVTVTVGAAVIEAVDDTGTVANGASGGTAVANVLVNDTLNGATATLASVTLTQVSTTNPNVTLDVATGAVNVAAGTPAGTYSVTYQICEQLNPTNCDTAVATVTVGAAVIDAVDDTGNVANGASGGTAVANVLVNDTLNGAAASLANVTLTQVSTTNPNVTLDVATGAVNVAPGTPAGTYTVTYQICEQLNPTNCDTATVTVTVGAAVIDAVNDTGTVANGASGGIAVANVLVNDTLNGASATLANVTLTQVSTTNPNVTLDVATGAVNVAPGTPAGTYTLTYEICEILNPSNCDVAQVTVTVGAAVIDAVDDTGSAANGASGGTAVANVLVNDTLNGAPATLATVTLTQVSTTHPNVTLDVATGAVNVAPGTPAGTYTLTYEICEILNPSNCDVAQVTVTVGAAVIDAVDDSGTVTNGASGGTAVADVLVNDTLNGAPATLATVTLTQVATTHPNVTLDPATGAVNVAAGTPAGTYTVTYQICEQLNPTNCDTAVATVTVGAAVIDAVDDTGTVPNGAAGGVGVANVLVNDTLNGAAATLANVTLTQLSTSSPNVTLDPATGAVNVAAGTPAGTYTVTYQICEQLNPTNCDTAVATVTVGAAPIDAIDDAGSLSTTAGGVAVANVLANDTLDGSAATLANVSLAQVSTTDPNVTLDPATGAVNVAPGTPAGTYLVTYQICELLNPTNCDTAIATVTVVAPAVAAVDDAGSTTQNTAIGIAVLGNDSFGGATAGTADVTVEIIGLPANGSAVVNADGSITYTPSANYSGPDQLRYRICGVVNPGVCAEAVVDIVVAPNTVTAPDDSRVTAQATPVSLPLMAMAGTGGGAPLDPASLQIVGAPANGSVVVNADGTATYTPDTLFFGTDSFQYRVCDQSVPTPVCAVGTITVTVEMAAPQLRISKTTPATTVRVGDFVRYSITVENIGIAPAGNVTLLDVPPTGFTYVEGSLRVDDADGVHGLAGTQPLRITGVDIPVGGTATVGYLLRVGAGTGPGLHTNTVSATDALGNTVSNVAQADVLVEGDPLMEDSLVIGTVFLDLDGDGRQQAGEPGLAGVRLATVEGLVVETDVHGRFHLLGLEGGNSLRGRNAIVKVDVATLPPGSRFTTPNPLVRRITPGLPVRFDFGVQLPGEGSDTAPGKR